MKQSYAISDSSAILRSFRTYVRLMSRPIVTKPKVNSICCKLKKKQILKETSDCRLVARRKQFKNRIYRLWREKE